MIEGVGRGDCIFELVELIGEIEHLRAKMIKIKEGKYFSHPEVVAASQELDSALNKYQVMLENIKLDTD
ncbi:MAG TPA: aspartyl-phosphate phosphatase Spo0E family protein [Desulfosporosinus sp.]|nr:aspartyl-phosphate phosphatase Spo0E family protein [Desulfosporosinus sp.]